MYGLSIAGPMTGDTAERSFYTANAAGVATADPPNNWAHPGRFFGGPGTWTHGGQQDGAVTGGGFVQAPGFAYRVTGTVGANNAIRWGARARGSAADSSITVALVDPGVPASPISVSVTGSAITVSLTTNGVGAITATAQQVITAVMAEPAALALVVPRHEGVSTGAGVVAPVAAGGLDTDSVTLDYYEDTAQWAVTAQNSIAFSAMSDGGGTAFGIAAALLGKGVAAGRKGWAVYAEGHKEVSGAACMVGEWNVVNFSDEEVEPLRPYGGIPAGHSGGLSIASGGDAQVNPNTFAANHAIRIANNGNTFQTALAIQNTALEGRTSSLAAEAIEYAIHVGGRHAFVWDVPGVEDAAMIYVQNGGAMRVLSADDIEIAADGQLRMPGLPGSDPGVAGALWNDGGDLKVSAG